MKRTTSILMAVVGAVLLLGETGTTMAASPPERLNFQGVLRDASGTPIDGGVSLRFRFYDTDGGGCPAAGGTLLLTNLAGAVTVTSGLFTAEVGTGISVGGAEPTLADVFRNRPTVFMEVGVDSGGGFEALCPRIKVLSAAYSLNADHLDGKDATEFLDTSATSQTKAGDLGLNDLTLNGNDLFFGEGARLLSTPGGWSAFAGESGSDDIKLFAGPTVGHGFVDVRGDGTLFLRAGNGFISFGEDGGVETAALDPAGNLQIDGALTATSGDFTGDVDVGGVLMFADGSTQTTAASSLPPDTCFDNVGRFVDCGDGAVKDNFTGLFWLSDANCFGQVTWADASIAVAQLGDGQCGLTDGSSPGDWRLPTKEEWQGVVDQAIANLCAAPFFPDTVGTGCCGVDPCAFASLQSNRYWSSSTHTTNPDKAWGRDLNNGLEIFGSKPAFFFVWPVRSGP